MSDETSHGCGDPSVCYRCRLAESERKLTAMTTERDDYRAGAQEEARRCDTLLAERNRSRNETLAALEQLEESERKVARLDSTLTELVTKRDADLTRAGAEVARLKRALKLALYNVEMLKRNSD